MKQKVRVGLNFNSLYSWKAAWYCEKHQEN